MVWLKYYRAWGDYGVELCSQLRSRVDFKTVCNGLAEALSGMGGSWPWPETLSGLWPWWGAAIRVSIEKRQISIFFFDDH